MDKILLCAFKLDLIDYASVEKYEGIDELWESIARTLGVTLDGKSHVVKTNKCNCTNGVCTIC
jgi:sulfate adenylyltransferase subunit 1 (EFTu-like GTPase family)